MPHTCTRFSKTLLSLILIFSIGIVHANAATLSIDKRKLENQLKIDLENEIVRNLNSIAASGSAATDQAFTQLKSKAYHKTQKIIIDAIKNNSEIEKLIENKKKSVRIIYKQITGTEPYGSYIKSAISEYQTGQSKDIIQKFTNKLSAAKNQVDEILRKSKNITEAMEAPDADYAAILKRYGMGGKWIKSFESQEKKLRQVSSLLDSKYGDYWSIYKMIHEGMEGNQPDKKIETLFKLMEGFGSKIPVLGDFVKLYGEAALAMLEATNKLKQTMAKFDEGCVGQGAHLTFAGKPQKVFMQKYPGERACPDGGIKNLYYYEGVELTQTSKLYFWTGTEWIHTDRGSGGLKTLKTILTLLAKTEAKYGSHIVQSNIQTAFKYYDIDYPGGFNAIYNKAKSTLKQIDERAKKLASFFVHTGGGSSQIVNDFMLSEAYYNKQTIEEYRYQKFDYFVVRYIKGFLEDEEGAYLKHNEMLTYLQDMSFCIVWGNIKSPAKKIEDLNISIVETPNITVLDEIVDGNKKEYAIIMNIHPGAMLKYKLMSGEMESKLIKHKPSKSNRRVKIDIDLGMELAVTIEFPKSITVNEKAAMVTTIEGGEPPYELMFLTSEKNQNERLEKGTRLSTKLQFKDPGPQWIEVLVTDKNKLTGKVHVDFEVKNNFNVSLASRISEPVAGDKIQIDSQISGGVPPYHLSWKLSNGKSLQTTKSETDPSIYATYKDPGDHWVKLSVKDSGLKEPMSTTAIIHLKVLPKEFGIRLEQISDEIMPGQPMIFHLFVTGGEPPFILSGAVAGTLPGHTGELTIPAPDEPGDYNVTVNVTDNLGKLATLKQLISVDHPFSIRLETNTQNVIPEEKIKIDLYITGGQPPFKITGPQSGVLETREGVLTYQAPDKPGKYAIRVKVRDKQNLVVENQISINVKLSETMDETNQFSDDPLKNLKGIDWGDVFEKSYKESTEKQKREEDTQIDHEELQEILGGPFPDSF